MPRAGPIGLDVVLNAARALTRPIFTFHVRDEKGRRCSSSSGDSRRRSRTGGAWRSAGPIENPLVPGSYTLDVYVAEDVGAVNVTVQGLRLLNFSVDGPTESQGMVVVGGRRGAGAGGPE